MDRHGMSSPSRLRFGISPCPNDTFVFHGLLTGTSDAHGLELEIVLADVQELNDRLLFAPHIYQDHCALI